MTESKDKITFLDILSITSDDDVVRVANQMDIKTEIAPNDYYFNMEAGSVSCNVPRNENFDIVIGFLYGCYSMMINIKNAEDTKKYGHLRTKGEKYYDRYQTSQSNKNV